MVFTISEDFDFSCQGSRSGRNWEDFFDYLRQQFHAAHKHGTVEFQRIMSMCQDIVFGGRAKSKERQYESSDSGESEINWQLQALQLSDDSEDDTSSHEPGYSTREPGYNTREPGYNTHELGYDTHEPTGYNAYEPTRYNNNYDIGGSAAFHSQSLDDDDDGSIRQPRAGPSTQPHAGPSTQPHAGPSTQPHADSFTQPHAGPSTHNPPSTVFPLMQSSLPMPTTPQRAQPQQARPAPKRPSKASKAVSRNSATSHTNILFPLLPPATPRTNTTSNPLGIALDSDESDDSSLFNFAPLKKRHVSKAKRLELSDEESMPSSNDGNPVQSKKMSHGLMGQSRFTVLAEEGSEGEGRLRYIDAKLANCL